MSHDAAFAAFRAQREAERAATVKVTWRKVHPDTGGGWSALGPNGALGYVDTKRPSGYDYGRRDGKVKVVLGTAATLARAKRAVERMFADALAIREEACIVHAVNRQDSHQTGDTIMGTKITGLTALNVRALNELMYPGDGVVTSATTATFSTDAEAALKLVETRMYEIPRPSQGHPVQSLHAVVRKLRAQAAKVPSTTPPVPQGLVKALTIPTTTAPESARKEATVATETETTETTADATPEAEEPKDAAKSPAKKAATAPAKAITAEEFAATVEGIEAVRAAKAPTARLRANGKTLAYADDRKGGFMLNLASKAIQGAPAKEKEKVTFKGDRALMRVTADNAKAAASLVAWLAKAAAPKSA